MYIYIYIYMHSCRKLQAPPPPLLRAPAYRHSIGANTTTSSPTSSQKQLLVQRFEQAVHPRARASAAVAAVAHAAARSTPSRSSLAPPVYPDPAAGAALLGGEGSQGVQIPAHRPPRPVPGAREPQGDVRVRQDDGHPEGQLCACRQPARPGHRRGGGGGGGGGIFSAAAEDRCPESAPAARRATDIEQAGDDTCAGTSTRRSSSSENGGTEQGLEKEGDEGDGGGGLDGHRALAADAPTENNQQEAGRPYALREHVVAGEVTTTA